MDGASVYPRLLCEPSEIATFQGPFDSRPTKVWRVVAMWDTYVARDDRNWADVTRIR